MFSWDANEIFCLFTFNSDQLVENTGVILHRNKAVCSVIRHPGNVGRQRRLPLLIEVWNYSQRRYTHTWVFFTSFPFGKSSIIQQLGFWGAVTWYRTWSWGQMYNCIIIVPILSSGCRTEKEKIVTFCFAFPGTIATERQLLKQPLFFLPIPLFHMMPPIKLYWHADPWMPALGV